MNSSLQLTEIAISHLNQTRKWANFLAIFGFITSGLLAIVALSIGSIMATLPSYNNSLGLESIGTGMITVIYLALAGVCFLIYLYLYRFSNKLKGAINSGDAVQLEESFKNLKLYYKANGIILIVILGIYLLTLLIGLIAVFSGTL